jgi:hypothetical protein
MYHSNPVFIKSLQGLMALVVFLFVNIPLLPAQQSELPATITWSAETDSPGNTIMEGVIATYAGGIYTLRRRYGGGFSKEAVFVEFHDKELKLKRSQELELKYEGKMRDFERVVLLKGQLYFFTSFANQAKKKNYLFYQTLNERLVPSKKLVKISEVDAINKERKGAFNIETSRDSSKILIYAQLPYQRREPERFSLQVFNDSLNLLWQREIVLPYADNLFSVEEYRVDNQGNVYLLGVRYKDGAGLRRRGTPDYEYVILAYTQDGSDVKTYEVDNSNYFLTDMTFRVADNGHLICSGFYSNKGAYSIKGACFFRIDPREQKIYEQNFKPFDFDFLTEHLSEGARERARRASESGNVKRDPELYQVKLDELILRSDGGAVMVAEQFYVQEYVYRYWDGTLRYDYYYNYYDIIVVNIRPNGEIEWATRIPKRQETVNDEGYFSSYAMTVVRDRFYFIYNDNARNLAAPEDRPRTVQRFNGKQSIIALAEISKDGNLRTWPLYANRDADILTRPKACRQIGSRKMAVYGESGRRFRFATLQFQ